MPKSKRQKVVALTKVKKKDREWKEGIFAKVHALCDEYPAVYAFRYFNMRNERLKDLRQELQESSKFLLASTKKVQAALGRTPEEEYKDNLHLLAEQVHGFAGLFCTKLSHDKVVQIFSDFFHEDYARPGAKATETVTLPEGPLKGPGGLPFAHTLEATLRNLGLPTKLNKGVIELIAPKTVCVEGAPLTANQAALLRHFQVKMATFRLKLRGVWRAEGNAFEDLRDGDEDDDEDGDDGLPELDPSLLASMMLPEHLK